MKHLITKLAEATNTMPDTDNGQLRGPPSRNESPPRNEVLVLATNSLAIGAEVLERLGLATLAKMLYESRDACARAGGTPPPTAER